MKIYIKKCFKYSLFFILIFGVINNNYVLTSSDNQISEQVISKEGIDTIFNSWKFLFNSFKQKLLSKNIDNNLLINLKKTLFFIEKLKFKIATKLNLDFYNIENISLKQEDRIKFYQNNEDIIIKYFIQKDKKWGSSDIEPNMLVQNFCNEIYIKILNIKNINNQQKTSLTNDEFEKQKIAIINKNQEIILLINNFIKEISDIFNNPSSGKKTKNYNSENIQTNIGKMNTIINQYGIQSKKLDEKYEKNDFYNFDEITDKYIETMINKFNSVGEKNIYTEQKVDLKLNQNDKNNIGEINEMEDYNDFESAKSALSDIPNDNLLDQLDHDMNIKIIEQQKQVVNLELNNTNENQDEDISSKEFLSVKNFDEKDIQKTNEMETSERAFDENQRYPNDKSIKKSQTYPNDKSIKKNQKYPNNKNKKKKKKIISNFNDSFRTDSDMKDYNSDMDIDELENKMKLNENFFVNISVLKRCVFDQSLRKKKLLDENLLDKNLEINKIKKSKSSKHNQDILSEKQEDNETILIKNEEAFDPENPIIENPIILNSDDNNSQFQKSESLLSETNQIFLNESEQEKDTILEQDVKKSDKQRKISFELKSFKLQEFLLSPLDEKQNQNLKDSSQKEKDDLKGSSTQYEKKEKQVKGLEDQQKSIKNKDTSQQKENDLKRSSTQYDNEKKPVTKLKDQLSEKDQPQKENHEIYKENTSQQNEEVSIKNEDELQQYGEEQESQYQNSFSEEDNVLQPKADGVSMKRIVIFITILIGAISLFFIKRKNSINNKVENNDDIIKKDDDTRNEIDSENETDSENEINDETTIDTDGSIIDIDNKYEYD